MFTAKVAFSGFSVNDQEAAKKFYTETLGLTLEDEKMGLTFSLPNGGRLFAYPKDDHQPATYTMLNLVVDDIDAAIDELESKGVTFEQYDMGNGAKTDEKGVLRGLSAEMGPDIAWFKDPAGNILSIMQDT